MMRVGLVLLACLGMGLPAADVLSWNDGIAAMRAGKAEAYCVYIGRERGAMWQAITAGKVNTSGVPMIHLSAAADVLNPFTNRPVSGRDMIATLTGPLNDLTGGSFIFFSAQGTLIPELTVIQNFHRNRPEVLELYCRMVLSPLRGKMSLAEFATFEGMPIGKTLMAEVAEGKHKDFAHLFRQIPAGEIFLRGVDAQGQARDPLTEACITVITRDPNGEVFLAQMRELWIKLAVRSGTQVQRPPLLVLGPAGATYPGLQALGIECTIAAVTREQIQDLRTPTTILPGNQERQPTEITGFIPGQVVGSYLLPPATQGLLTNFEMLHPDIPVGDYDD